MSCVLVSIDSLPRRPCQRSYLVDFVVLGLKITGPNCYQLLLLHVSRLSGQLGGDCNRGTHSIWFSRWLEHISFGVGVHSTQQQKSASAECALTTLINSRFNAVYFLLAAVQNLPVGSAFHISITFFQEPSVCLFQTV